MENHGYIAFTVSKHVSFVVALIKVHEVKKPQLSKILYLTCQVVTAEMNAYLPGD